MNFNLLLMPAPVSVGQRFVLLIKQLGVSKNAFAQSLGKTATVVQHLVDERNKPGYDLLCKVFEVYPNVSRDWLLLGQGPMLLAERPAGGDVPLSPAAGQLALPEPAQTPPLSKQPEQAQPVEPVEPEPARTQASAPTPAAAASDKAAAETPTAPAPAAPGAPNSSPGAAEAVLTAALHAQHLQHQLALAEQRNQHLLEQQRLMQQLLDFAQRR